MSIIETRDPDANPVPAPSRDRRLCDAALTAFQSLPPARWRGRLPFPGGEIVFADPELARQYGLAARHALAANEDPRAAIRLFDQAIRLDQPAVLEDAEHVVQRVEAWSALGEDRPARAILLYNLGVTFSRMGHWKQAATVYRAADEIDPVFAWSLNNFAWMAATFTDPRAHAGDLAVALAEHTCATSGFGCWAFLGTLAAAHARAGDFGRAVAWQRIARTLTPVSERAYSEQKLATYEAGQPFVDSDPRPLGGYGPLDEAVARGMPALWREAQELMGIRPEALH
ncbi:MAG: hypothetical protein LCH95_10350 [Proteobacteria bacterium]|nr:hypothetical protein [Pseudomonadota bacterium]